MWMSWTSLCGRVADLNCSFAWMYQMKRKYMKLPLKKKKHIHNYTTPFPEIFAVDLSGFTLI
jgi:hypothetical protein